MNLIDKRLYNDLFIEKKVVCENLFYEMLYHHIWPCEKDFKDFLLSTDNLVKTTYAKKIINSLIEKNDIQLPKFFFDEIIRLQEHKLIPANDVYNPQDHYLHVVNLYILGIYVFFNIKFFHDRLLNEITEKNHLEKHKIFLKKWAMFSFCHDIGYVIEANTNLFGEVETESIVEQYLNFNDSLAYQYAIKITAKLLLSEFVLSENTNEFFEISAEKFMNSRWFSDEEELTIPELKNTLERYTTCVKNNALQSWEDEKRIYWLLEKSKYLIEYKTNLQIPLMYILYENNTRTIIYNQTLFGKYNDFFSSILYNNFEYLPNGVMCTYYVEKNLHTKMKSYVRTSYKGEVLKYYDKCLPIDIKNEINITTEANRIETIYSLIFNWLENICTFTSFENTEKAKNLALKKSFDSIIKNTFEQNIDSLIEKFDSTTEILSELNKCFSQILPEALETKTRNIYAETKGISSSIQHFHKNLYANILNHVADFKIFNKQSNKISIVNFVENANDSYTQKIISAIKTKAKNLGISLDHLINYKTNYTNCDHGIVSALLLLQCLVFASNMNNLKSEEQLLSLNYYECDDNSLNQHMETYADVVFAIMLHNVYTSECKSWGIPYKHNFKVDAFSYFAALMDNLQKWGRPNQAELADSDLPKNHFLDGNFDVDLSDQHINIICSSHRTGYMRNEIDGLEAFLPGASKIIQITESEIGR